MLANFITAYTAPVAVALTAECQVGDSVVIRPLDSITTGNTSNLTVTTVAKGGATGAAFIGADKQSVIYVASTSGIGGSGGATDTITYEINDGINESSAANIVITLIP